MTGYCDDCGNALCNCAEPCAAGVCASCRDHRQGLEAAGEVIARLAGLLERARHEIAILAACSGEGDSGTDCLLAHIDAALGDHKPAPKPVTVQCARRSVDIGGVHVRPIVRDRLDGSPEQRLWLAVDRLGWPHYADNPEAAARAAGARITHQEEP